MSAGSATVCLLLFTQSGPSISSSSPFSSLFPLLSFLPICLRLSSPPCFLCFSPLSSISSFLSSSFFLSPPNPGRFAVEGAERILMLLLDHQEENKSLHCCRSTRHYVFLILTVHNLFSSLSK